MGIIKTLNRVYSGLAMSVFSRVPIGKNIYERDWDLLILLDTCRIDALKEVAPEYKFINDVSGHWSLGSSSPEFMAANFTQHYLDQIKNTAYISGNAHTQYVFEERVFPENHKDSPLSWTNWDTVGKDDFLLLDQPWRYTEDMRVGLSDPRNITERAISVGRELKPARQIVHYNQPHAPYAARALRDGRELEPYEQDPFNAIRDGIDRELIWETYLDELRFVLDEVELLLNNVDVETAVISADHGELFGRYLYSHPSGLLHPKLRKVPWALTSGTDGRTYDPTLEMGESPQRTAEERLKRLGYI
jgi:hypothetical protein